MTVQSIDHVAIPIENVDEVLAFYETLGFRVDRSLAPRLYSVHMAEQKLNFHDPSLWRREAFTLRGPRASPGCGDFCFVWTGGTRGLISLLSESSIPIEEGPVSRVGGRNAGHDEGTSIYVRDPDQNLVEFICYDSSGE